MLRNADTGLPILPGALEARRFYLRRNRQPDDPGPFTEIAPEPEKRFQFTAYELARLLARDRAFGWLFGACLGVPAGFLLLVFDRGF